MINKNTKRLQKKKSIRKKIFGTPEKPRMAVFRSLTKIYVQIIDDVEGKTLLSASSLSKEIAEEVKNAKDKTAQGAVVGEFIGKKALESGIKEVVFDRGGYRYHGRVRALAEGARKSGIKF